MIHPFTKQVLLLLFFFTTGQAMAQDWTKNFYTDDSAYYHQLSKDGFVQRLRVDKKYCHQLRSISVELNSHVYQREVAFKPLQNLNQWPKVYGLNEDQWCWFSAKVEGLNLDQIEHHQFVIKFVDNQNKVLYFQAPVDSLLPHKRLVTKVQEWMSPGPLGATPLDEGVYFKIWEPLAQEVHLFINDQFVTSMRPSHEMGANQRSHHAYIETAKMGDRYHFQFIKDGKYEEIEVSNNGDFSPVKIDPMARELTYQRKGGSLNAYLKPRAVVASLRPQHNWIHDQKISGLSELDYQNWIMYQLWPLAFNPQKKEGKYQVGTFKDILPKRDYLEDLGVTAIEFLPVHESRFNASWGYAMDSLTLIEKTYGSREDLAFLVDQLHEKKIKVVLDVVINHVNNHLLREPLAPNRKFTKFYGGDTDWGPKPDFENIMVQRWIAESLMNLARDYHADGFRFDMIEYVYKGSAKGYQFIQELNTLLKMENPRFYSSAEQLPDNVWATYPIIDNGLGFDSQWNDKFKNFFELEFDEYQPGSRKIDLSPLKGTLMGYSNHRNWDGEYSFGHPSRVVNYLGSHDVVGNKNPILRIVSDFESYEAVDGNNFYRVRPLEEKINTHARFRQIHNSFTHGVGKLSYGILYSAPGAILFFQGEEFAQDINIENEWSYINAREGNSIPTEDVDVHRYVGSHRVPWEYLNTRQSTDLSFLSDEEHQLFKSYHAFHKQMIQLRSAHPEINLEQAQEIQEQAPGIVTYKINAGEKTFFVIANFSEDKKEQWLSFPGSNKVWWSELVSTADKKYGISNGMFQNIVASQGGRSNLVRLEAASFNIFVQQNRPSLSQEVYLMSAQSSWKAQQKFRLKGASDQAELYATEITLDKDTLFEFKIANQDWSIEMGATEGTEANLSPSGQLGYTPELGNAQIFLEKGKYRFLFNTKNFRYNFISVP